MLTPLAGHLPRQSDSGRWLAVGHRGLAHGHAAGSDAAGAADQTLVVLAVG